MEADKDTQKILEDAIDDWQQSGLLTPEKASELRQNITRRQNERQQIAQYFFTIALFCTLPAFGAIFLNEKLLERIKKYFSLNNIIIAVVTAVISVAWFWYIAKKRKNISAAAYEVYIVLGGLTTLTSLVYMCKEFGTDRQYTGYLAVAWPVLAIVSILCRSRALWIGALIAFCGWFGAWSTSLSHDNLFLGMNYPVRFTVFGLLVLTVAIVQFRTRFFIFTQRITYVAGFLIFFTGLWGVSIFGNYNNMEGWQQVRQIHVLAYSIVFAIASAVSFLLGVRYKDDLARDFGVLFLLINLYTRYFEFFWDTMNKGIFFLILAVTFGFLGWLLDRKSHLQKNEPT